MTLTFDARSPEWKRVPDSERNKLGIKVDDDGDFW